MGCFVVTEFLLTTASRGPSAIAEPLVVHAVEIWWNSNQWPSGFYPGISWWGEFQFSLPLKMHLVIYTSRAYATMSVSVCLSVTEVHWHITANLVFKFRSKFTARCGSGVCREEGRGHLKFSTTTSRVMLATARPSCSCLLWLFVL